MAVGPSSRASRTTSPLAPLVHRIRELGLFYHRRARVVRCDLLGGSPDGPRPGIEVREASEEDLHELATRQQLPTSVWRARRASGSVCLIARSGSVDLGYLWITRSAEVMTEVHHTLDVSRDEAGAYLYDGFVFAPYRRLGILRTLLGFSKRWAAERGVSRLYAAYVRENRVSEHALRRAGFVTVVGDIRIVCVLGREWKWIQTAQQAPMMDVLGAGNPAAASPRPV